MINKIIDNAYDKWGSKNFVYEKINDNYEPITYGCFITKTKSFAHYLINRKLKNQKIIIYGKNSINYMIADLAVLSYVGISVNIAQETSAEEINKIIKFLDISAIIYDEDKKDIILSLQKEHNIEYISMNEINSVVDDISNLNEKDYDECSKIVFSSGTTSNPKAVMLSLKNIFAGWEPLQRRTKFDDTDVIYLFLPLHHTYGNIYNFLYSFLSGLSIYLSSGVNNISSELLEINPTIFCAVPLIYRKFYEVAKDKLIYAFGNRIKYLYCGGSYLDTEIRKYYKQVGLPLHEAYALTETASSFSIEYTNNDDFESVGTIFENIDVKIIDSDESGIGEIIVKGDNVCLGYANNEQMNKQNFVDGYFKTGDLGYIKDNKLYLTGRKKKVLVGENGENVYIEEIINKLKELNQNINHAKIYFEDNQLCATVYVKEEIDVDSLFIEYNNNSLKKDKIHKYKMIIDNINSRLKG